MKFGPLLIALAAVLPSGCTETDPSYHLTTTAYPAGEDQYAVEFKIQEMGKDGPLDLVSAPRITLMKGQEGRVQISDDEQGNGIVCTALFNEAESGIELVTTITIQRDGQDASSFTQTTLVDR